MPFEELEENQDETKMLPAYELMGAVSKRMPLPQAAPELCQIDGQFRRMFPGEPPVAPKPSIGQRILQIGRQQADPFAVRFGQPAGRQTETAPQVGIGHRILAMGRPKQPSVGRPEPLPNWRPWEVSRTDRTIEGLRITIAGLRKMRESQRRISPPMVRHRTKNSS